MTDPTTTTPDPIQDFVNTLVAKWAGKTPSEGIKFLLEGVDSMVQFVEDKLNLGSDKKAAVLQMAGRLYDDVLSPMLPFWLKPANSQIKDVLVNVIVGELIDFIVGKYNNSTWVATPIPAPSATPAPAAPTS